MQAERWKQIERLFHGALDCPADQRSDWLERNCGDAALRLEVQRLLQSDAAAGGAFDSLGSQGAQAAQVPDPWLGRELGVYRLEERLGAGGMGVVYRAVRNDGLIQQEVAIKLVRAEWAGDWSWRRFEFERRTLAGLQHPGIARLFDAGTAPGGGPYFVMELVAGQSIARYCAEGRLKLRERLLLFIEVCRAVHYAHTNLVVHCDLKPANILVDKQGRPKLLDFGIARLIEGPEGQSGEAHTLTQARLLTPEYASPEQLAGRSPTIAVDVYSLGVILYELLTGRRPFESHSRSPLEWERLVREQVPTRPSQRVLAGEGLRSAEQVADQFQTSPKLLARRLTGDLDRILLMALRKEPERRYSSVQALCSDLELHLEGRPVVARGDSFGYRWQKFLARNRVFVSAAAAVFVALTIGLGLALKSARLADLEAQRANAATVLAQAETRRAESATLRAETQAQLAAAEARHAEFESDSFQNLSDFLLDAFLPVQAAQDAAWLERAAQRIAEHAARVRREYADNAHVRANLLEILGQVNLRLGLLEAAEGLVSEAAQIRLSEYGPNSSEHAQSLRSLAQLAFQRGQFAAAAEQLEQALSIQRQSPSPELGEIAGLINDLAACLRNQGQAERALELHAEALSLRRTGHPESLVVAESLNNQAAVYMDLGRYTEAIENLRAAEALRRELLGPNHPLCAQANSNLAIALWQAGEQEAALLAMQEAKAAYRALRADGAEGLGLVLTNLATMHQSRGDLSGAAVALAEGIQLQEQRLGPVHPQLLASLGKLAQLQQAQGDQAAAERTLQDLLARQRALPKDPRALAEALYLLGVHYTNLANTKPVAGPGSAPLAAAGENPSVSGGAQVQNSTGARAPDRLAGGPVASAERALSLFNEAIDLLAEAEPPQPLLLARLHYSSALALLAAELLPSELARLEPTPAVPLTEGQAVGQALDSGPKPPALSSSARRQQARALLQRAAELLEPLPPQAAPDLATLRERIQSRLRLLGQDQPSGE
jgi:serine/threonine-protein kinase